MTITITDFWGAPESSSTRPPTNTCPIRRLCCSWQSIRLWSDRCCRWTGSCSDTQVETTMYCTSGLMSGCGLLTWVRTERTSAYSGTYCYTQVLHTDVMSEYFWLLMCFSLISSRWETGTLLMSTHFVFRHMLCLIGIFIICSSAAAIGAPAKFFKNSFELETCDLIALCCILCLSPNFSWVRLNFLLTVRGCDVF